MAVTCCSGAARYYKTHQPQSGYVTSMIDAVRQQKRAMIGVYTHSNDVTGVIQVLTTIVPLALLWWLAVLGTRVSSAGGLWLTAAATLLITLFTLRVFALMHECGHGSLFRSAWLNRAAGFALGVVSGMPQYVWSQHHNYHHTHNGNWERYRGPYATRSVEEYAAMSARQQRMYRHKCSMAAAPLAGFIYLIFNPRFTWLKGSLGLLLHCARGKRAADFRTPYWKSSREYWHMFWNNVVLLSIWVAMCWAIGTTLFIVIYLVSVSVAGGAGIVLFTVQHNFEHSYASDSARWDYDRGAIHGTSFLILPRWLNWFTANIGYHHIHHLSASIPNYRLVRCHNEHQHLFRDVTRVKLSQVHAALKCILWDARAQQIISVAEYRRHLRGL
jgi:omega-6 fatty acid desaturase (delta-12 desaturase)